MPTPNTISDDLNPSGNGMGGNALKDFALDNSITSKTDIKFGEKIVLQVEQIINSSYFSQRNDRFSLNRAMAAGHMDTKKFMDFFNMNGKTNYVNISWKSIMIVNTIISRLVGRWMAKKEKASVTAVDPISVKEKKEQYDEAEFMLYNKELLAGLQEESGVQMISPEEFIPDDKDHLDLWAEEEQRIPEEILNEKGINTVFDENSWNDVLKRKLLHDSAEVGLIGTETIADKYGRIQVNYCKPENIFYSYSEYPDFRDAAIKGEIVSYTISTIKDIFPKLTVAELFEIAKSSKQWQNSDKIKFDSTSWNTNMFLPFDDWNIDVVRFTLRSLDVDKNLIKISKDGTMYVDKPKKKIEDVFPGNEYVEKTVWNIYRGIYIKQTKKILSWGLEKNMVRPQNYERVGEASHPYSFYMYQNTKMRNLAVPEKIEEPVEMMILTRLKIQQFVATMRNAGLMYDIDGLQAMDLGNGIATPLELQRVTDQTGNVYYRSRDAEGNRLDRPITETPNASGISKMQELIQVYNFHLEVLRGEIGINEFAEGQTIKPRVGIQNVQTSLEVSFNSTDYMKDACVSLMQESAEKIVCLLHDSVEFGSSAYRKLMAEKDVKNRDFKVKIEMLPTEDEITKLMQDVDAYVLNHPDFILYISPFKIRQIAKDSIKLANLYFELGQKRAIQGGMKQVEMQSKMNSENQIVSAQAAEQEKRQTVREEIEMKSEMENILSKGRQKDVLLNLFKDIYSKGIPVPDELKSIESQLIENIGTSLFAENSNNRQVMEQAAMEGEEEQIQEQV